MNNLKEILVLTDFSPAAWQAMRYGGFLCRAHHANMTLLHVLPSKPSPKNGNGDVIELFDNKLQSFGKEIQLVNGNAVKTVVLSGNVSQEIAKYINQITFDMVIMGLNGNGGMNSELGKNTKNMLERSGLPVLVMPSKPEAA